MISIELMRPTFSLLFRWGGDQGRKASMRNLCLVRPRLGGVGGTML
jgi:hypothetical protein